jgi:thioredoxin-like negative regulator of GroEL
VVTGENMKIVKLGAPWCGACTSMDMKLRGADIVYESINIDEDDTIAKKYGVRSIPQLFVFDENDNVVSQISNGNITPTQLAELKKISG